MTPNRQRPRAELQSAIFEAAIVLFRTRGYAGTSVDEIVAAAGVAKGTFFNFFPTKLDVMKAYDASLDVEVSQCRAQILLR